MEMVEPCTYQTLSQFLLVIHHSIIIMLLSKEEPYISSAGKRITMIAIWKSEDLMISQKILPMKAEEQSTGDRLSPKSSIYLKINSTLTQHLYMQIILAHNLQN
jgi:hypothetical protein